MKEETYQLVPNVDNYYFKCLESQIIAITYHYCGEFCKLFIGQRLEINFADAKSFIHEFSFKEHVIDNARKYYGISLDPVSSMELDSNQEYLVVIENKNYPLSYDVDDGYHSFIVCGDSEEGYLVFDNFYKKTTYVLDHEISKYFTTIYRIKYQKTNREDVITDILNELSITPKWIEQNEYKCINASTIYEYVSSDLYDILRDIASYIKRDSILIRELMNDDEYICNCANVFDQLSQKVKLIQCSLLKSQLKFTTIPYERFIRQINEVIQCLLCQYKIRQEIIAIKKGTASLKSCLKDQLFEYLNMHEIDLTDFKETDSVYEIHDKASIMYLINYYEECNHVDDISLTAYTGCTTYVDYMLATHKEILLNYQAI